MYNAITTCYVELAASTCHWTKLLSVVLALQATVHPTDNEASVYKTRFDSHGSNGTHS